MKKTTLILILFLLPQFANAHPGNTASDGCHYCRTNCSSWGETYGARHCHGGSSSYSAPSYNNSSSFLTTNTSTSLRRGSTGEKVRKLQEVLAKNSSIYPEGLVTGNFGPLTEQAVKRFQTKYDIDPIGQVGPITRAKIKAIFDIDL